MVYFEREGVGEGENMEYLELVVDKMDLGVVDGWLVEGVIEEVLLRVGVKGKGNEVWVEGERVGIGDLVG